jgi:OmpA-OmpF porin, OOP family
MNTKALLTLLAFLGWILFCNWWWCTNKETCDCDIASAEASTTPTPSTSSVIRFNANERIPITGDAWINFRDSIATLIKGGKRLEITAYYGSQEQNNTAFANLGMARADTIKQLFLSQVSGLAAGRFSLRGELKQTDAGSWEPSMLIKDTIATPTDAGGVVALDSNDILIYFPSGSANKELSKEVDAYLTTLGARLKASGEKANVVGHTDNKGKLQSNLQLSKSRAESVKKILESHGAIAANITTDGKADSEPVADNNTDAGRRQNRRVQIKISK